MDCRTDMVWYSAEYAVLEVLGMFEGGTDGDGGSMGYEAKARVGEDGAGVGKELGGKRAVDIVDPDMEDMVRVGVVGVAGVVVEERSEGQALTGELLDVVGVVVEGEHYMVHCMVVGMVASRDSVLGAAVLDTGGWSNAVVVVVDIS